MRIDEIDKNFKPCEAPEGETGEWYSVKDEPFKIYGLNKIIKGEKFTRMDEDVAAKTSDGVKFLNYNTAGGRIRFKTDSSFITIKAILPDTPLMAHFTRLGQSGFDLYKSDSGIYEYVSSFMPGGSEWSYKSTAETDGKMHTYTINMPLYNDVEDVFIQLSEGARLLPPEEYKITKPVLYYGSSITQGGCASRPGNAYQNMVCRTFDCDYINLGFSGNAKGEDVMAEYIADIPVSVFVYDYDHNAPDVEHLKKTHAKFFGIYRKKNPDTPVIFLSKPDYRTPSDEERRQIILETYNNAVKNGDKNVYFIDGAHIFDGVFRDSCTVDGCHPNDLGFSRMAEKINEVLNEIWK